MEPVIITAAITGAVAVPSLTSHLPWKTEDIVDSAVGAAEAGAAIVHIHARNPADGSPSSDGGIFGEIMSGIKKRSDVVICMTTGGSPAMTVQERTVNVTRFEPEMCSFNLGSMNFGLHQALKKKREWRFEWEPKYLEASKDFVFKNTFFDLEHLCGLVRNYGTKPELEAYDVGHLYNLAYLVQEGLMTPPMHIQFVMGVLGGIGTMPEDLTFLKRKADTLFGTENYTWSVCAASSGQFNLAPISLQMGGHVRVGLEDNIYLRRGVLAESNAQLVEKAVAMATDMGRQAATPADARRILGLKGLEKVKY
ncbi:MAG: 3-keto-5-aminohexanoate cleavage protein [Deltaproteobacteria bacterium]|nr:3-keto-5-aminohexanoate cleavage protein [Deltaproteobacteria bacterium]